MKRRDIPEAVSVLLGEANLLYATGQHHEAIAKLMDVSRGVRGCWRRCRFGLRLQVANGGASFPPWCSPSSWYPKSHLPLSTPSLLRRP